MHIQACHIENPGLFITWGIFKTRRTCKMIMGYWCIFSHTYRCAHRREREGLPCLFRNWKKCPDFGKKSPNFVHLLVKYSIENVVLRISRRNVSKMFPCRVSFSCVFDKKLSNYPSSLNPLSPALKYIWLCISTQALYLKYLTVF